MKLSQLSTDECLDFLCELTPYINNIVIDENLIEELRRTIDPENVKTRAGVLLEGANKLNALIPIVLNAHRADVYGILSILNHKTREEVAQQNIITTGTQIREVVQDKELTDFFKSFLRQGKTA